MGFKLPQQACEITVPKQCVYEPFSFRNHVVASLGCLNWWDDSAVAEQKISWYKADSPLSLCDLLVLSLLSAEWFYSFLMSHVQERGKVFDVLRHRFAWTEISASTEMVMTIHQGNTLLWAGDGRTTIKRECRGFRGRRTRGMEWEIQVGNLRSPFQESDRFWSLYPPLIKACQWGWSLWHRSLHTLVVLLNYSSCSCDNIVIRRSLIEFTVWLWPIGR